MIITHARPASTGCASISAVLAWMSTTREGGTALPLTVRGICRPWASNSWMPGTPSRTQGTAVRFPNTIEPGNWPPVAAPLPVKTALSCSALQPCVPAGIGVGLGVGSNIDTGLVAIQGTGVGCEAAPVLVIAEHPDATRAIARRPGTPRSICSYNVGPGDQLH